MKFTELANFISPIISVGAIIWQIAEMKSAIYKYIDSLLESRDTRINQVEKETSIRINQLEKDIAIHKRTSENRTEFVDYQLNGILESINHKFNRCMEEIKRATKQP